MWYRVFAASEVEPDPAKFVEHLHGLGFAFAPHFKGDDLGWTSAVWDFPTGSPVTVHRYLTKPDELRAELNAFAAELETQDYSPHHGMLMERVIQAKQLFALRKPIDHSDDSKLDELCDAAMDWLARTCDGVIQIDGVGWRNIEGDVLLQEY